jgi:hypothetical protein
MEPQFWQWYDAESNVKIQNGISYTALGLFLYIVVYYKTHKHIKPALLLVIRNT